MHVKSNEEGDVFLQLERAVKRRERRQRLDGVEGRDAGALEGALDEDGHVAGGGLADVERDSEALEVAVDASKTVGSDCLMRQFADYYYWLSIAM